MMFASFHTENNKENTYSLAVRSSDKTPFMFYFLGYDILLGSHYDEYVIFYDKFVAKMPSKHVFDVPNG